MNSVYVYLIAAEFKSDIQYKVGVSNAPDRRINELKTANPNVTHIENKYLCESREIATKVETWMHKYYSKNNINGEWFLLEQDDIEEFTEKCKYYEERVKTYFELENKIKGKDIENRLWK